MSILEQYAKWLMPDTPQEKRGASTLDAFTAGYDAALEAAAYHLEEDSNNTAMMSAMKDWPEDARKAIKLYGEQEAASIRELKE